MNNPGNYPYLQNQYIRGQATTALLTVATVTPLLFTIGKPPEIKLVSATASSAIAVCSILNRKSVIATRKLLEEHLGLAGVERVKAVQTIYKPKPKPTAMTLRDQVKQCLDQGMDKDTIIEKVWGLTGDNKSEGYDLWRTLGLPDDY